LEEFKNKSTIHPTMLDLFSPNHCLLLIAAIVAGMFNGIAGGGSFIAFPALVFTGLSTIEANATSTLALWFGAFANTIAYRHAWRGIQPTPQPTPKPNAKPEPDAIADSTSIAAINHKYIYTLVGSSLLGGLLGSALLLTTADKIFALIVPYLMALATALFAFSPAIKNHIAIHNKTTHLSLISAMILQFAIAIYGGYFGGGVSIMMLAAMSFMGFTNVHAINGLKSLLGNCMNGVAIVTFIIAQKIAWGPAILMAFGAVLGAVLSAKIAQKAPEKAVRNFIIGVACIMTAYLFSRLT
jgi:uncharacterized protein